MLQAKSTSNHTGVTLTGDYLDFERLYEALHNIVGEEGEYPRHYLARLRVLGVCYDIRHAMMGDREIALFDNNMDTDKMKWHSTITPEQNVYYSFNTLWPEAAFVVMALNDFIFLKAKSLEKYSYKMMFSHKVVYEKNIVQVRQFQSVIMEELANILTPNSFNEL